MFLVLKFFCCFFLILLNFSALSNASNKTQKKFNENILHVLVEDSLIQEGFAEPTPSVSIIQIKDIQKKGLISVAEILKEIPGLSVASNGGLNQATSVFIRGAESRHTLVLIDNIEVNDPLNPSRSFDFSGLSTEQIERIEVFRGAQSVRFGSDAIGGVINIITKEGKGPFTGLTQLEIGSYNSLKAGLGVMGAQNNLRYSLGVMHLASAGFSAADKNLGNTEADGFSRLSLASRLGWVLSKDTNLNLTLRSSALQSDLDAFGGPTGDDPNYTSQSRQLQIGSIFKSRGFGGKLAYSLGAGLAYSARAGENLADATRPNLATDYFSGINSKLESKNEYLITDEHSQHILQFGAQLRNESGYSENSFNGVNSDLTEKTAYSYGAFATYKIQYEQFFSEFGLRQDLRNRQGAIASYSLDVGYKIPEYESVLYFNYGTGFKTPSLYQLYSASGNQNLNDEKSNSTEFSIEKSLGRAYFFSTSYFINQYYDLIDFDSVTSKYFNIAKSSAQGIELQTKWLPAQEFSLKATLTHLQTKNQVSGAKLLRRPENSLSAEATAILNRLECSIEYFLSVNQDDIDPVSFQKISMPDYDLVNLKFIYTSSKKLSLNARIINLLNKNYQSVAGYGTAGFSVFAGVTKTF